jgi:hypothetical protein
MPAADLGVREWGLASGGGSVEDRRVLGEVIGGGACGILPALARQRRRFRPAPLGRWVGRHSSWQEWSPVIPPTVMMLRDGDAVHCLPSGVTASIGAEHVWVQSGPFWV